MKNTALTDKHIQLGAKMVPFAGYNMPVQYAGINVEHETVRKGVGVFDVSHMGEFILKGEKALDLIQRVTSNDASKLYDGKVQYSCLPNENGGIVDDLLVYRARCCNPIRGEEIIGYVTRGKGVAVHARSCPNVQNLLYESDRRIQVEWAPMPSESGSIKAQTYPVKLTVLCEDRTGMLKEFTAIISDDGTNIRSVDTKPLPDGQAMVDFVIEATDVRHLNRLVERLRRVPGVREVQRVQKI